MEVSQMRAFVQGMTSAELVQMESVVKRRHILLQFACGRTLAQIESDEPVLDLDQVEQVLMHEVADIVAGQSGQTVIASQGRKTSRRRRR